MARPTLKRGFWRTARGQNYLQLMADGRLTVDEVAVRLKVTRQAVSYQQQRWNPTSVRNLGARVTVLERLFNDGKAMATSKSVRNLGTRLTVLERLFDNGKAKATSKSVRNLSTRLTVLERLFDNGKAKATSKPTRSE